MTIVTNPAAELLASADSNLAALSYHLLANRHLAPEVDVAAARVDVLRGQLGALAGLPGDNETPTPRTWRRPKRYECKPDCDRTRHAVLRRMHEAILAAIDAAGAVLDLPEVEGGLDEQLSDESIKEDLAGWLWSTNVARCSLESHCLGCCFADADVREMVEQVRADCRRMRQEAPTP